MLDFIKKYWDLIAGVLTALVISCIAKFKLEKIQLCYSIIILMLGCIGICRVVRQEVVKRNNKKERKHNVIDSMVDGQKPIKAISLAQSPTKEGEKVGKIIIIFWGGLKKTMKKFKQFCEQFKGYMLAIALTILTVVEMFGGFINSLCGGVFAIKGVPVLPTVTLVAAIVVAALSNGFTKEQNTKIKALFSKSTTAELVFEEIKKTIKEKTAQLKQFNQALTTQTTALENLESELETLNNTLQAKKEMANMTPQLATAEDVQLAANAVVDCQAKIETKKAEIEKTNATIANLTKTIEALKSQI